MPAPSEAQAHHLKAEKARRRYLQEECECSQPATPSAPQPANSFETAVQRVRDELKAEGFGILSEIDVQATLHEKLGVDEEPYLILGACNPPLAHQALSAEPDLGTLLPCNVVIYQRDGETHISAIDAERMLSIVSNDNLASVAAEVRNKLAQVVERASNPS